MSQITPVPGPSQADFDALNGNVNSKADKQGNIYATAGQYSVTLKTATIYLMAFVRIDTDIARDGLYMVYINNNAGTDSKVTPILQGTGISSTSIGQNGTFTFTTASNWMKVSFIEVG